MRLQALEKRSLRKNGTVYLSSLFFSLSYAAVLYVNSSYLGTFFSNSTVSLLFILGAFGNLILYFLAPVLLRALGNRRLFFVITSLLTLSLVGLATIINPLIIAGIFILNLSLVGMMFFCLDIFVEHITSSINTGEIRGIFMTIGNAAVATAPLLVSQLASSGVFRPLYIAGAVLLVPILLFTLFSFKTFKDVPEHLHSWALPVRAWWHSIDIRRVTITRFVLEFFFAVMVIYMPVYLSQVMGFEWSVIGIIFTIMLLPFVLFELPAGELADHWCGEKEIMTIGFFIMGGALLVMPFLGANPYYWAAILFMSRVGASFVEITTDVYFFKKVEKSEAGLIAIYRLTRPLPIITGALVGGIFVTYYPLQLIFFVLAVTVFFGMFVGSRIKDTK